MGDTDTDSESSYDEEIIRLSVEMENFSNESKHKPGMVTTMSDRSLEDESIIKDIIGIYYGNGNNEDNRGYVSIVFNCQVPLIYKNELNFNFTCVVAIKDAAGNKKFIRTFTFPYDVTSQIAGNNLLAVYTIDRYIAREILLNDKDDLLPGDVLNLVIDIEAQKIPSSEKSADIESTVCSSFEIEEDSVIVLSLNTELGKRLYETSSVFRDLDTFCQNPEDEDCPEKIHLRNDNKDAFINAGLIIMGAKNITFKCFDDIVELYIFADKYNIQSVISTCRKFCKSILYTDNSWGTFDSVEERVDKISEVATLFNDDILKEEVDKFLENQKEGGVETRQKFNNKIMNFKNVQCEYSGESPYLYFELEDEGNEERPSFEFYN